MSRIEKGVRVLTVATLLAGSAGCGGETGKNRNTLFKANPTPATTPIDEKILAQITPTMSETIDFWLTPTPSPEIRIIPTTEVEITPTIESIRAGTEVVLTFPEINAADAPEVTLEAKFTPVNLDGSPTQIDYIPAVSLDVYGNQWIWVDSGYRDLNGDGHKDPLQFEGIRFKVQGGKYRSKRGGEYSLLETQTKLEEFIGKTVIRTQDGKESYFIIRDALIVPNEIMDSFASWSGGALDDAIALDPRFEFYKTNRGEFYVSCLRLPPEQEDDYRRNGGQQYSWMRLVLALIPISN